MTSVVSVHRRGTAIMARQIYVNLPVRDLKRTQEFFTHLGFGFEPKFTDEKAACMIAGENIFVMLLAEPSSRPSPTRPCATRPEARKCSCACRATAVRKSTIWSRRRGRPAARYRAHRRI